jgi:hypothetical protein
MTGSTKQSRDCAKSWIASSLTLLAMTETKAENTDETAKEK